MVYNAVFRQTGSWAGRLVGKEQNPSNEILRDAWVTERV